MFVFPVVAVVNRWTRCLCDRSEDVIFGVWEVIT